MRVYHPGARVNDIVYRINNEIEDTLIDSSVIAQMGTNDEEPGRSE